MFLRVQLCLLCWLASVALGWAADRQRPSVTITGPTTAATYVTNRSPLLLSGTASDRKTGIARVTWQTAEGASGVATGTTAWSAQVGLPQSQTHITVTATDGSGNTQQDTLLVTLLTPPPPPGPITVEWSYNSVLGDAFQLERCTVSVPTCPMATVASIALGDRTWTDTTVAATETYCYRMAVTTGADVGDYSNTKCSG
jgi:hypothetical protein